MDVTCSARPCPILLNSSCVFYTGDSLIYTGITTNDSVEVALQKIDDKFKDASIGYIFNNGISQLNPGNAVQLGGSLIQNTILTSNGYTFKVTDSIESQQFITTGGTSLQFVKGDGSLDSTSYQPIGSYITQLTGDATASGPGSAVLTLANTGVVANTYGTTSTVPRITVNSKGLLTDVTDVPINIPSSLLIIIGDVQGTGYTGSATTLTLNNVNNDVYTSISPLKFTVNTKGLITSASPLTNLDLDGIYGYTPVPTTRTITINGITQDLSNDRTWTIGTSSSNLQDVTDNGYLTTNPIWIQNNYAGVENNSNGLILGIDSGNPRAKILTDGFNSNLLFYFAGTEFTWRDISGNDLAYLRLEPGTRSELQIGTNTSVSGIYVDEVNSHSYLYLGDYGRTVKLKSDNIIVSDRDILLPDGDGTLTLSVNGNYADPDGNITLSIPANYITSVSNTSTINLDVTAGDLTATFASLNISQFTNDSGYLTTNQTITLSGDVTGTGNTSISTSIPNTTVTGKLLTGYVSGAGTISATDSILSAIQKLNGNISGLSSTYFPLVGGSITGTAGAGYFGAIAQSSTPSTPSSGFRLYADASGKFSWIGTNGFFRTFDGTANTANRTYTLPDASGTLLLNDNTATVTNKTIAAGSNTITGLTNSNLSGSAGITNANLANSAITIAGTSTSLGVSITLDTITGLSTTGIVKRTATNTLAIAVAGTDYQAPLTNPVTGTGTTNEIAYFTGTSTISSLTTGTYPSLTELSYVKGVTSAIQTQIDTKGTFTLPSLTSGSVLFSNGSTISQNNSNLFWDNTNVRLGIGNTSPSAALDITGATQSGATSVGILNLTQTWNNTGANPTAFKLNVTTSTNPTANALLMDLQQSGTSRFKVDYKGTTTITGTSSTQPAFTVTDNIGNTFKVGNGITNFNTVNPLSSSGVIRFESLASSGNLNTFTSGNALNQTTGSNLLQLSPTYTTQTNAVNNTINIVPTYNLNANTTSSSIQRGVYYNPTITTLQSAKHIAWENTTGNVYLGTTSGNVGIGLSTVTAKLHIAAGTATANTAPQKYTAGTLLSSFESGASETDSNNDYFYSNSSGRARVGMWAYVAKTANYTATNGDYTIDCTSGTFTVTLPTAVGMSGRQYIIKNSGSGTITISTTSSQTIDGVTTKTLSVQYGGYVLQSNGSNWIIIGAF